MEYGTILLVLAGLGAFFMAFTIGANDVANSFASAVGSKAISMRQALFIAGIMNLVGAILLGGHVAAKVTQEVVQHSVFPNDHQYVLAMFSVLLAAGLFVLASSLTAVPVSTTHAIIGSLTGIAIFVAGWEAVNWLLVGGIVLSWLISPLIAGLMALVFIAVINRLIIRSGGEGTARRVRRWMPWIISGTMATVLYALLQGTRVKESININHWEVALLVVLLTPAFFFMVRGVVDQYVEQQPDDTEAAEGTFRPMQVGTSSYVAFAHGANDVANAISPIFAIYLVVSQDGDLTHIGGQQVPFWILAIGAVGIMVGIGALGHRVMTTLGERITPLRNSTGFSVDVSVASTVLTASLIGLPVSSTHAATGAIVGVGVADDPKNIKLGILGKIVAAWLITLPVAAVVTILIYAGLSLVIAG